MAVDPLAQIYDNMKQQHNTDNVKTSDVTPKEQEELDEALIEEGIEDAVKKLRELAKKKKAAFIEIMKKIDKEIMEMGEPIPDIGQ